MKFHDLLRQVALTCLLAIFACPVASAAVATFTVPTAVSGDTDGDPAAPWVADAVTPLVLDIDTVGVISEGSLINSVTVAVSGEALDPSYLSEPVLRIVAPDGSEETITFRTDLGYPNQPGSYDTGALPVSVSGGAAGVFRIEVTEDWDDAGDDTRIDSLELVVDYTPGSFGAIGAYLNGVFPATDPGESNAGLPLTLSATGAFADLATMRPAAGLTPYGVNSPLWSDRAVKTRWLALPGDGVRDSAGEKIGFDSEESWDFPAGTVLVKHFELPTDENDPAVRRRLETRFLVVLPGGNFYGLTYRWRPDGSEADLLAGGASDTITIQEAGGGTRDQVWDYPSRLDCTACHNSISGPVLGPRTHQLNGDYSYEFGVHNQLRAWSDAGMFDTVVTDADLPALLKSVPVNDTSAPLEDRVRSYLDANCSHCHVPGNLSTGFDLRFTTPLEDQDIVNGQVLYPLGIPNAHVVTPGEISSSLLHFRMETTGIHRMPALGSNEVDTVAVETVAAWITSLPTAGNAAPAALDDNGQTFADTPLEIFILSNDTDAEGEALTVNHQGSASHGDLVWNAGGSVTYTPDPGFIGEDSFTYTVNDAVGQESNVATVTVTVSPASASASVAFTDQSSLLPMSYARSGAPMGVMDMDADGKDDIIHLANRRNLFIAHQAGPGEAFVHQAVGVASSSNQWGMAIADTDNDGYPEIASGGAYDGVHYFRTSNGGSSYLRTDHTTPVIFTQAINFADLNNDHWLDLFVCHDVGRNAPWRNQQNGDLVYDISLIDTGPVEGNYGSVWTDYDNDGDLDLYISKCRSTATSPADPRRINQLFRNDGGSFVEVAAAAGLAFGEQSWTADFADIDNDGDLDCFVGNHMDDSYLCRNNGDGTFTNITVASGVDVHWSVIQCVFRDFNNDGWVDLLLTGADHEIWVNNGDSTFTREDPFTGGTMHSCAVGDLNSDGFTDIFAGYGVGYNALSGSDRMWHATPNGNGFLSVRLEGVTSNRMASGAWLELHGPWGVQVREVRNGEGYGITNSATQIFGMGNHAQADKLVVRWPSGAVDEVFNVAASQFLHLREGSPQAPNLVNPGNQLSDPGDVISLFVSASDPTGDELTFAALNLPAGLAIDSETGEISGTVDPAATTTTVVVSVTDGWSVVEESFQWSVQEPGDVTQPTIALGGPAGVVTGPVSLVIHASEPITGLSLADIYLFNATASNLSGSGTDYQVTLTPLGNGPVTAIIPDNYVYDAAGNGNVISNQFVFEADLTVPDATLLSTVSEASGNFAIGVTFTEEVTGLDHLDFRIINGYATELQGSGTGYALYVTPLAGGDIEVYLPANRCQDVNGNGNLQSATVVVPSTLPGGSASVAGEVVVTGIPPREPGSDPVLVLQSRDAHSLKAAWASLEGESLGVYYSTNLAGWTHHSTHEGDGGIQSVSLDLDALNNPGRLFLQLREE